MNKHLLTLLCTLLFWANYISAQSIQLECYLPYQAGDQLEFQLDNGASYSLIFKNQNAYDLFGWIACERNKESIYLENKAKDQGWSIHQIIQPAEKRIICTKALQLLPAEVSINQLYENEVSVQTFENGIKKKSGLLKSSATIIQKSEQETSLGTFEDCILIERTISLKLGKTVKTETWKEWYAKGIGLIKAKGKIYYLEKGVKSNEKILNFSIDKALLRGKAIMASN